MTFNVNGVSSVNEPPHRNPIPLSLNKRQQQDKVATTIQAHIRGNKVGQTMKEEASTDAPEATEHVNGIPRTSMVTHQSEQVTRELKALEAMNLVGKFRPEYERAQEPNVPPADATKATKVKAEQEEAPEQAHEAGETTDMNTAQEQAPEPSTAEGIDDATEEEADEAPEGTSKEHDSSAATDVTGDEEPTLKIEQLSEVSTADEPAETGPAIQQGSPKSHKTLKKTTQKQNATSRLSEQIAEYEKMGLKKLTEIIAMIEKRELKPTPLIIGLLHALKTAKKNVEARITISMD